ncbi:MAG: ORF6N domain-containing protein [Selenomonadaceae bacterium]|nr:ORF6N domain-containing protein [Selenomonadaceae bacterium]
MENLYPTIGNVTRIEYGGQPVITTAQLAEFYETTAIRIQQNFNGNEDRFISGKHYFKLEGNALKEFKDCLAENELVGNRAATLYLWTKRGAARHAKMLSTDRAWEVFEQLEDTYFNRDAGRDTAETFVSDFERGRELAKLAPHAKDPFVKQCIVVKAANLILGYDFLPTPENKPQMQLTLFSA